MANNVCAGVVDLDADSRRSLEFDDLLEWVAGYARSPRGAESVRSLVPLVDPARLRAEHESVEEVRRFLDDRGMLLAGGLPDATAARRALGVSGMALSAEALRALAVVLVAAARVRAVLLGLADATSPRLNAYGASLADLGQEATPVLRAVEPDGRLADEASPELARIRAERAAVGSRLRRRLEAFLRAPGSEPVIRDDFITQRNGRFVIPVRTDAPRAVRGIVHATSSSGATQFVEPLESVELNNDLVRLAEREQREEQRILAEWSDRFRARLDDVDDVLETVSRIDGLQARALFGRDSDAVTPTLARGGALVLGEARHPLLERSLRERGEQCVPIRLVLDPHDQVLVLSGPNTGGKTVALKTLGLAVLMAQSGIPVPATEARLPLFRQVRSDIGDHQSIEADLSTYSAHIGAVVDVLREVAPPSLLLFDEIGTGTEPTEGAALAQSILEELQRPGVTTMVTTHLGALKAWAFTTDDASCAAMEFDAATLRPTYRVLMGTAGVSAGLEIAARLGLDADLVELARKRLGPDARRTENYLNRLRELTAELEQRRDALLVTEAELAETQRKLLETADERERQRTVRVSRELDRALGDFRSRARRELASIRDDRERKRTERAVGRAEQRLRSEQEKIQGRIAPGEDELRREGWVEPSEVEEGTTVYVRSLSREGAVQRTRGDKVDVRLGRMLFTVDRADLRVRPGAPPAVGGTSAGAASSGSPSPFSTFVDTEAPRELHLLGKTVDEALEEVERFLDRALLAQHEEVRIVHGHGTGRLRQAVREFLRSHRQVESQRAGKRFEGGDGATVVRLR